MMLGRHVKQVLEKSFFKGKALVLVGAHQVGKTTVVTPENYLDFLI